MEFEYTKQGLVLFSKEIAKLLTDATGDSWIHENDWLINVGREDDAISNPRQSIVREKDGLGLFFYRNYSGSMRVSGDYRVIEKKEGKFLLGPLQGFLLYSDSKIDPQLGFSKYNPVGLLKRILREDFLPTLNGVQERALENRRVRLIKEAEDKARLNLVSNSILGTDCPEYVKRVGSLSEKVGRHYFECQNYTGEYMKISCDKLTVEQVVKIIEILRNEQ
jgi:hypothetical protein